MRLGEAIYYGDELLGHRLERDDGSPGGAIYVNDGEKFAMDVPDDLSRQEFREIVTHLRSSVPEDVQVRPLRNSEIDQHLRSLNKKNRAIRQVYFRPNGEIAVG